MNLLKSGSQREKKKKRRVLKRPRWKHKHTYITIMTRDATTSTATCLEGGDMVRI
jgi:fumarate reductase subunit C